MQEFIDTPGVSSELQFLDTTKATSGSRLWQRARPLRTFIALAQKLRAKPRCVFAFSSAHASFWEKGAWLMLARWRGVPMVVMMVDGNFPLFYESLSSPLQACVRSLLSRYTTVIVQTQSWLSYFQSIAPGPNYHILSNGVDCEAFTGHERHVRERPVVLFVGWLIPGKGLFDLMDAAELLRNRGCSFVLRLIGPPHGNEDALRRRIASARLEDVVELAGVRRSRDEVRDAYREADVFVLPSWAEGLPNALLEAMATGLAVVATRVGGMVDVVEDGVSGILVAPRDAAQLADALERLLREPDLRRRMGIEARKRVESSFNNDKFYAGLRAILAGDCQQVLRQ